MEGYLSRKGTQNIMGMREWKREDVGKGGGYSLNTAHGRRGRENESNKASYRDPKLYDRIPGLQVLLPS